MNDRLRIFTELIPGRGRAANRPSALSATTLKLVLPFEQRKKARQRVRLTAGFEVGIQLPRGTVLRGGDRLRAADGTVLEIVAAPEPVSTVWSRDLRYIALVAYHLGNRHVALEVGTGSVRYLADHVLDAMVAQLGLTVVHDNEPFEPEAGAYGGRDHGHDHDHDHDHGHGESGEHAPRHLPAQLHDHDHDHDPAQPHEHRVIFGGVRRLDPGHDQ